MFKWNDGTELYHHGIKGQKWGVRRFQNEDGSLTAAGRERYGTNLENRPERKEPRRRFESGYSSGPFGAYRSDNDRRGKESASRKNANARADDFISSRLHNYMNSRPGVMGAVRVDGNKIWNQLPKTVQDEMLTFMSESEAKELLATQRALYYTRSDLNESSEGFDMSNEEYFAAKKKIDSMISEVEKKMKGYANASNLKSDKKRRGVDQKVELN